MVRSRSGMSVPTSTARAPDSRVPARSSAEGPTRNRTLLVSAAAAAVMGLGAALPASADTTGLTTATVTGGVLAMTVPTDAGSLGSRANTVPGGTISGPLGQV